MRVVLHVIKSSVEITSYDVVILCVFELVHKAGQVTFIDVLVARLIIEAYYSERLERKQLEVNVNTDQVVSP